MAEAESDCMAEHPTYKMVFCRLKKGHDGPHLGNQFPITWEDKEEGF